MNIRNLINVSDIITKFGMPIVSKTDTKGKITEVNDAFLEVTGYKKMIF